MKLSADKLGKRFNREWIFRNLSYQFEAGNTYAITGPNGSGKSTLMQILWGQLPATTGEIKYSFNDQLIAGEEIFRSVAIATSYMELVEEYTLKEMVTFHFQFKKTRGEKTPDQIIDLLELSHAADKQISAFSSGMRQRLKLGLALLADAPMVFLDEPTTNLDQKAIDWYIHHLAALPSASLILIASNQTHEYPVTAKKINISDYK
jgi:ABC-type multidrug transport system ATPase subunit